MTTKKLNVKTKKDQGTQILDNGLVYEGDFKDGEWHGTGKLTHQEGFR